MSDEIYRGLTYDGSKESISEFSPERTIVGSSLSKEFAADGWRCGWMVFPDELNDVAEQMSAVTSSITSCISHPIYYAAEAAHTPSEKLSDYNRKSRILFSNVTTRVYARLMANTNLRIVRPQAAWYLLIDFEPYREQLGVKTSDELVDKLIDDIGVVGVAGSHFGLDGLIVRFSCADIDPMKSLDDCMDRQIEGVDRLIEYLEG
jgi:aspartate aminotransferase